MAKDTTLISKYFQPMGFKVKIITNSTQVIKAAEAAFGGFGSVDKNKPVDFEFSFFEHAIDDGTLKRPIFREAGDLLYQTAGRDSTLVADRKKGVAYGYFSATTLAALPFFRFHFLELAFFVMLAPRGFMGVHGAAIVKNGQAILLRAQSGGGKTTLAYAAARSKFKALAEDVVWLDMNSKIKQGSWWGMPWTFHLLPDAKDLFAELTPYEPILQTNQEMKLEVLLETIRPNSTTVFAQGGPVVLVERLPGGKSYLEPIALAEAKPLWLAGQAGTETTFPNYEQLLESLLDNNTYRLHFGDDIDAAVDLLESLLEN